MDLKFPTKKERAARIREMESWPYCGTCDSKQPEETIGKKVRCKVCRDDKRLVDGVVCNNCGGALILAFRSKQVGPMIFGPAGRNSFRHWTEVVHKSNNDRLCTGTYAEFTEEE